MLHFLERMTPVLTGREPDEMSQALSAALSSEGYDRKLRAMYVDLQQDEEPEEWSVRGPHEIVKDEEAQQLGRLYANSVTTFAVIIQMSLDADADGDDYPPMEESRPPSH